MSGATPPNNKQTSPIRDAQTHATQSSSQLPIQGVSQAPNQIPLTTSAQSVASTSSFAPTTANASINNPAAQNTCSEYCLEVLTQGAWRLDTAHYVYEQQAEQVDLFEALFFAGELPENIHAADPFTQGVLISYDGYSENRLTSFFNQRLNPNHSYILRTGSTGENGGHYGVLYYSQGLGWFMQDNIFGQRRMIDQRGMLTNSGRSLLAPMANWGPENMQSSLILIEMTPRRIAILTEYMLRYRYFGTQHAQRATESFRQNHVFPNRPMHPYHISFPPALPIASDANAMRHSQAVATVHDNIVPYQNRGVDRALMALSAADQNVEMRNKFRMSFANVQQQSEINLLDALEQAGETGQTNTQDSTVIDLNSFSTELQTLNTANVFFLRVGTNFAANYYALSYRQAPAPGWYFFDRMTERSRAGRKTNTRWYLLADSAGNLTPHMMYLVSRFNAHWGLASGELNLQIIEATPQRQRLLQRYTQYYRHVSDDAALALLRQHRLRLSSHQRRAPASASAVTQIESDLAALLDNMASSQADTRTDQDLNEILNTPLTPSQILQARLHSLEVSQATALQENPQLSMDLLSEFISQTDSSILESQIELLNLAINHPFEEGVNIVKFTGIRMFLEGESVEDILKVMRLLSIQHNCRDIVWDTAKFDLMLSYFRQGGITLLRGFSVSHRQHFPADMMQSVLASLTANPAQETTDLLTEVRQNISLSNILFTSRAPSLEQLESFLNRCGYQRRASQATTSSWHLNTHLLQTELTDLPLLPNLQPRQTIQAQKRSAPPSTTALKKSRATSPVEAALNQLGYSVDYRTNQQIATQINELELAQSQAGNNFNRLKFLAVKLALEGFTLTEIQTICDQEVIKIGLQSFKLTSGKLVEMLKYYLLGGVSLLRGFAHAHESTFSARMVHFILNQLQTDPRVTAISIYNRMVDAHNNGAFPEDLTPPSISSIRQIIRRLGYTYNPSSSKWSL